LLRAWSSPPHLYRHVWHYTRAARERGESSGRGERGAFEARFRMRGGGGFSVGRPCAHHDSSCSGRDSGMQRRQARFTLSNVSPVAEKWRSAKECELRLMSSVLFFRSFPKCALLLICAPLPPKRQHSHPTDRRAQGHVNYYLGHSHCRTQRERAARAASSMERSRSDLCRPIGE
jgi:hypothetical protein